MLQRKPVFPHVIEMNYQAGQRIGCNVYLVFDGSDWLLIDIGFEETVDEIVELIRQLDFPLSHCKMLIATHADVDHMQGLAKIAGLLKAKVVGHQLAAAALETGDQIKTFAEIDAQGIHLEMPPVKFDQLIDEGDRLHLGNLELEVWHTPGHTDSHLSFRLGNLLFSGDNIYRDGCVGAIDAHHGSDIPAFIKSLHRIRSSDVEWLLAEPRADLPQGQRRARSSHRPTGGLSAHGRLWHLRHRLAADGRMGQGAGQRQDAAVVSRDSRRDCVLLAVPARSLDCVLW